MLAPVVLARGFAGVCGGLGLLVLSGCAQYGGAIHGHVSNLLNPDAPYEVWKKVPVPGAFVFVKWSGRTPGLGHGSSVCLHLSIVRADARGRFIVPSWWAPPKPYPVFDHEPDILAEKRGTKQHDVYRTGRNRFEVVLVKDDERPPGERLGVLETSSETSCGFNGRKIRDRGGALGAYYAELYEEARKLDLRTMSEKQRREDLLEKLDSALGRQARSRGGHRPPSSRPPLPTTQPPPPPPGHPLPRGPYSCC